jgi:hypothetical protein
MGDDIVKKIYENIYKSSNLFIAINSILVYKKIRYGFLIENPRFDKYDKNNIIKILKKYFNIVEYDNYTIVHHNDINDIDLNTDEGLGKMLSYPCINENMDFDNRTYNYTIYAKKNNEINNDDKDDKNIADLMTVICILNNDDIIKKKVSKFQKIVNLVDKNIIIYYERFKLGNVKKIINNLENKIKLKKFEKATVINLCLNYNMPLIAECIFNRNINLFKNKKFILLLINYIKYNVIDTNIPVNNIIIFQRKILEIYFGIQFSDGEINKIVSEYLNEEFNINDDIII